MGALLSLCPHLLEQMPLLAHFDHLALAMIVVV